MSPNRYLRENVDEGSPCLITIKKCAKSMAFLCIPRPKSVEQCEGFDQCKLPLSDICWPLCAGRRWYLKDKLTTFEWCENSTTDATVNIKYLLDDTTWHRLMSLVWSRLGLANRAFHFSTLMSPCGCAQVTAYACMH